MRRSIRGRWLENDCRQRIAMPYSSTRSRNASSGCRPPQSSPTCPNDLPTSDTSRHETISASKEVALPGPRTELVRSRCGTVGDTVHRAGLNGTGRCWNRKSPPSRFTIAASGPVSHKPLAGVDFMSAYANRLVFSRGRRIPSDWKVCDTMFCGWLMSGPDCRTRAPVAAVSRACGISSRLGYVDDSVRERQV